jgi:hypothetical protein
MLDLVSQTDANDQIKIKRLKIPNIFHIFTNNNQNACSRNASAGFACFRIPEIRKRVIQEPCATALRPSILSLILLI